MRVVEDPLNRETIQAITQLIVERFQPEQVILFGSCARGEENENSDLDLLILVRDEAEVPHRGNLIRLAIAERFVLGGIDVSEEVDKQRNVGVGMVEVAVYISIGLLLNGLLG